MRSSVFYQTFLELIQELYDTEKQIIKALPKMIAEVTNEELKKGLSEHLEETRHQAQRLETIFNILGEAAIAKPCIGIKGLIEEGEEILGKSKLTSSVKDCFIIIAAQKVEHYEIATYGSALSLVSHLKAVCEEKEDFAEIFDLLDESLEEEKKADKKLTTVAEGKLFSQGVNDEVEKEMKAIK